MILETTDVIIINPSLDAARLFATVLNSSKSGIPKVYWLSHYYPTWSDDGTSLGLIPRDPKETEGTDQVMILVSPSEEIAELFTIMAIPTLLFFDEDVPDWALQIKRGNPPLWAQTPDQNDGYLAKDIDVILPGELEPDIMVYLH